ncbi:DNA polymerase III subunit gamma/tau [Pseudorhodoplanes sinuspersici]|uniref:DNA polymerase III subunit gamma/tau n=1 Tax=Pseudorhodoplanes sinuspersici TaxID=1235591 RepID=A0A1W6ZNC0_9HYPH|nr:DNA polymerase III subunit gamma/tau [Pseudorhodoplanes sinuspersici]ARP98775.1 DNA polymerase III subunit gamma/tau [Pseudorhodoplanes sinuspersici]RKE69610.1 DNA polymerase III tau subunit [Pseudorhodoplanes sinuspersici]
MSDAENRSPGQTAPQAAATDTASGYRVLARRYRPSTFADLIGQDAMVRTVSNAFETGRIPQAWILTGVRGVGKTTTARILARALNYQLPDGSIKGPTIDMPVMGEHCQAIIESRHIDVLEMDAASHNSVDDVRQINDAVRYAPVSARYKVYILDEVHMLSGAAFNALLKTLEEPPPHAKFVFATTEIRKVPITVLSRCQRFDLRRVDGDLLVRHLSNIADKENVKVETEALALIARAAEGSVRDSLSLFDQAIAHAAGEVRADDIRQMLGLADRARVVDLFEMLLRGDIAAALKELRDQYDSGADPAVVLSDLAEFTHFVTRVKLVPSVADDLSLSESERTRGKTFAAQLSMRILARTWQMLLKGMSEVQQAGRPIAAAEMLLVRIAYAADLPTPDDVIRSLGHGSAAESAPVSAPRTNGGGASASFTNTGSSGAGFAPRVEAPRGAPRGSGAPALSIVPRSIEQAPAPQGLVINNFEELVKLATDKRDLQIKTALERDVRLVRCEDGQLEIALEQGAQHSLVNDLAAKFKAWTGRQWVVVLSREVGEPTLKSQAEAREADLKRGVRSDPLVQAVLERFPGAEIVAVRPREVDPVPTNGDMPFEDSDADNDLDDER